MELANLLTLEAKLSSEYDRLKKYLTTSNGQSPRTSSPTPKNPQYYKNKIENFQRENADFERQLAATQRQRQYHDEKLQQLEETVTQGQKSRNVFSEKEKQLIEDVQETSDKIKNITRKLDQATIEKNTSEGALRQLQTVAALNEELVIQKKVDMKTLENQALRLISQLQHEKEKRITLSTRVAEADAKLLAQHENQLYTPVEGARLSQLLAEKQRAEALIVERNRLSALYSHLVDTKSLYLARYKKQRCRDRQAQLRENLQAIESLERLAASKVQEIRALR